MAGTTLFKRGDYKCMVEVKAIDNYGVGETDVEITIRVPYSDARNPIFDGAETDLLSIAEIAAAYFVPDKPEPVVEADQPIDLDTIAVSTPLSGASS